MRLTPEEQAMSRGDMGPGLKRCIDILRKFGAAMGAEELVPIASAHTMPKEPPELLREMTDSVERTAVPTTLHPMMSAFSPVSWERMGIPQDFAHGELDQHRQRAEIYRRLGIQQTYCCLPMLVGNLPLKGQALSWIGSGAQLMANSLLGARCNRDGTVVNLAAALTGRTPRHGLLLDGNRLAQVVVRFGDVSPQELSAVQLGAVGYHVGGLVGSRNLAFEGIAPGTRLERLKQLMAPLAVSGAVCMCHLVGITPEAPTLEAATGGRKPELELTVNRADIRRAMEGYSPEVGAVDMALFGCPHFTIEEIKELASLLVGKRVESNKRLWVGTGHQIHRLAEVMGCAEAVESAGGVFASACMATVPDSPIPQGVRVIATNSFKAAHYITRLCKGRVRVVVGDMERCVAAVTGRGWSGGAES